MGFCAIFGFNILYLICEIFNINDVKNFYGILKTTQIYSKDLNLINKIFRFKFNSICYFNIMFSNLLLLLLIIISHGIILLGPRVIKYFYLDFRNNESN